MKLVKNNPYRIIGLLTGSTKREQDRQVRKIIQLLDAEQELQNDSYFPVLGSIRRTVENVEEAASKLTLDNDKMSAALFWFYNGNPITDEAAFDFLKEGDQKAAYEIWAKLINSNTVTQRNASAFHNLSTLLLCNALKGKTTSTKWLEKSIELKMKYLESDFYIELKKKATDETYQISKQEIQFLLLSQLQTEIEKNTHITSSEFLEILTKQEFSAKESYLREFVQQPLEQIEKKIVETQKKRKANPSDAEIYGNELYNEATETLELLQNIIGIPHIKYQTVADKVANEILQCGIDFFKEYKDEEFDPSGEVMDLFEKAESIAIGTIVLQRTQENIEGLQEWINNKPERDKHKKIEKDLNDLLEIFEDFDKKNPTTLNAKLLLNKCKPKLKNVKSVIGGNDELYLKVSTRVASQALHNIIEEVNNPLKRQYQGAEKSLYKLLENQARLAILPYVWAVVTQIEALDIEYDFKVNRLTPNKETLKKMCLGNGIETNNPVQRLRTELQAAKNEMNTIQEWQLLRSESTKRQQIKDQLAKINNIEKNIEDLEFYYK